MFGIPVALEAFKASKEVLVRRPAPPGIRPFLENKRSMTRAPRQLLTGWLAHSRPNGCPEMTWGRTLKKALKCEGLPVNFKEWRAIAEDRSEWRSRTYSKPVPPSENWSYRVHESKDEHCITQKGTQPSQTCSGWFIKTMLVVVVSLQLGSII